MESINFYKPQRRLFSSFKSFCIFLLSFPSAIPTKPEPEYIYATDGGLKFGHNGRTYSFSTETCPGGVFFKKPLQLDFMCPNGYFLKRANGCSNKAEEIIGAEKFMCFQFGKHNAKVQAFIPVTNADYPVSHTVTLYDDEKFLTRLRRYTVESAVRNLYIQKENGSSFLIVSNPRHTQEMSIGRLCYRGLAKSEGSAYKLKVKGYKNISAKLEGFFEKGCSKLTAPVNLEEGQRFPQLIGGDVDIERFSSEYEAIVKEPEEETADTPISLEDDESSFVELVRDKKDGHNEGGEVDQVFLDLRKKEDAVDDKQNEENSKGYKASESTTTENSRNVDGDNENLDKKDGDDGNVIDKDDGGEAKTEDDTNNDKNNDGDGERKDNETKHDNGDADGDGDPENDKKQPDEIKDDSGTDSEKGSNLENADTSTETPTNTDAATGDTNNSVTPETDPAVLDGSSSGKKVQPNREHVGSNENAKITINGKKDATKQKKNSKKAGKLSSGSKKSTPKNATSDEGVPLQVTDLKEEVIFSYAKMDVSIYVMELIHLARQTVHEGFGELDKDGAEIVNDVGPMDNFVHSYTSTKWYQMLTSAVEVVAKILPTTSIPPQIFRDALKIVGLMGKHINSGEREIRDNESKKVMKALEDCASNPKIKIEYGYNQNVCPPRLKNLTVWGPEWDGGMSNYKENVPFEIPDVRSMDQSVFGGKGYHSTSHMYLELMFTAFDIAYTVCYENFKAMKYMSAHSLFGRHVSSILRHDDLYKRWTEIEEIPDSIYLTLLPSWNGRRFPDLTLELDAIRYAIKLRSVPTANIDIRKTEKLQKPPQEADTNGVSRSNNPCPCGMDYVLRRCNTCRKSIPTSQKNGNSNKDTKINGTSRTNDITNVAEDTNNDGRSLIKLLQRINTKKYSLGGQRLPSKGKAEWLRRKRRNTDDVRKSLFKNREIWDGLAYCLDIVTIENEKGQTQQNGLEPSLQAFKAESYC